MRHLIDEDSDDPTNWEWITPEPRIQFEIEYYYGPPTDESGIFIYSEPAIGEFGFIYRDNGRGDAVYTTAPIPGAH